MTLLPPCDPEIFKSGTAIAMLANVPYSDVEAWIIRVREKSEQPVDWSAFAGRSAIRALGDLDLVRKTLEEMRAELPDDHMWMWL